MPLLPVAVAVVVAVAVAVEGKLVAYLSLQPVFNIAIRAGAKASTRAVTPSDGSEEASNGHGKQSSSRGKGRGRGRGKEYKR